MWFSGHESRRSAMHTCRSTRYVSDFEEPPGLFGHLNLLEPRRHFFFEGISCQAWCCWAYTQPPMVLTRTCCKDLWLANGWHCWICNRNGKTGAKDNWRGPFGVRRVESEPHPRRGFTLNALPETCAGCDHVFEWVFYRPRSSCTFCHTLGVRTVCHFLTHTFGDWGDVHQLVFAYLFVPVWQGFPGSTSLDCSGLVDWLEWIRKTFGEERVTGKIPRTSPPSRTMPLQSSKSRS